MQRCPPTWPEEAGKQQQMAHLDIVVGNLDEAVAIAEKLGAKKRVPSLYLG